MTAITEDEETPGFCQSSSTGKLSIRFLASTCLVFFDASSGPTFFGPLSLGAIVGRDSVAMRRGFRQHTRELCPHPFHH
jgi:hypothetical protein